MTIDLNCRYHAGVGMIVRIDEYYLEHMAYG